MKQEYIIRHLIEESGCSVELFDGEWRSVVYNAIIYPLWRKKSSDFESSYTEIGTELSEYYHYIGSSNHAITELSDNALLKSGDTYYEFKHRDEVRYKNGVLYYSAILRKLKGEEYDC